MKRLNLARVWSLRGKNFAASSWVKHFALGALMFSLIAWPGNLAAVSGQQTSGTWTLKQIRIFNNMEGHLATITSERYDENGGSVDLQISGNVLDTCPGGYEKLRFSWRFERSMGQVVHGGSVSANLEAGQVSRSQNCSTGIATRSTLSLLPSSGGSSPFSIEETRLMDGERFIGSNGVRVWAAEGERTGIGTTRVNTHAPSAATPYAFFSIYIGTPTKAGGGWLRYVYLYERGGGGSNRETRGAGFGPRNESAGLNGERLTYYRGTTPEQCQADCAKDERCKGWTLIRAGAYNTTDPPMCYLMSAVKDFAPSPCCISAIKR